MDPGEFMCRFESRNPVRCIERHLNLRGLFYGLVRGETWKNTFREEQQPTRETVAVALLAYLEEQRPAWEAALAERDAREAEARARAEREAAERAEREAAERAKREAAEREALERAAQSEEGGGIPANGLSPETMEIPSTETLPPETAEPAPESVPVETPPVVQSAPETAPVPLPQEGGDEPVETAP